MKYMKNFLFFFISLATLNSAPYAAGKTHFDWMFTQESCRVASKAVAEDALKLSEVHLLMLETAKVTKPNSKERAKGVQLYDDAMEGVQAKWNEKFREFRQSTDINKAALANFFKLSVLAAVNLSMTHPGKDLEWYQDKIFDECVKDD
uniref:hypothetical protein n=1 Tax=Rheinheimera sp. TaxID=1869214 RepID=UPI0040487A66